MSRSLRDRLVGESGQAMLEYALLLALTSLAIISALLLLRDSLGNGVRGPSDQIGGAASSPGYEQGGTGAGGAAAGGAAGGGAGYGTGGSSNGYDGGNREHRYRRDGSRNQ
jgi:Flp pilus assembly pilin Flp